MEISVYDSRGRRKYLTLSEGRKFASALERESGTRRAFPLVLHYTGCRISEALRLHRDDIDWTTGTLQINSLKRRRRIVVRRIPLPVSLLSQLQTLADSSRDGQIWSLSRSTGYRIIKSLMAIAGIEGIHATAKGLRHGFGVRCALSKIPVHIIQKWMGHADPKTTAIYLDVMDEEERELMSRTWK